MWYHYVLAIPPSLPFFVKFASTISSIYIIGCVLYTNYSACVYGNT